MRRNLICIAVLLLGFVLPAAAQNKNDEKRIQLARVKYAAALANIAAVRQYIEDDIPNVNYTTVVRQQNWSGSGQRADKMEFYYDEVYDSEEEYDPYPTSYRLVIVRRTNELSMGEPPAVEEYVYDDEGRPLFWFTKYDQWFEGRGMVKVELRQYYDEEGEAIRVICKAADENGQMKECAVDDFVFTLAHAVEDFARFKTIFDAIYNMDTEN